MDIRIVRRIEYIWIADSRLDRRSRPRILPALNFGMAVRKTKAARSVMVEDGQIPKTTLGRLIRPTRYIKGAIKAVGQERGHIVRRVGRLTRKPADTMSALPVTVRR